MKTQDLILTIIFFDPKFKNHNCRLFAGGYLLELAKEQIKIAFEQAEKELQDLRQRTKEGIETACLNGKQIGQKAGAIYETKTAHNAKAIILKHNFSFGGSLNNEDFLKSK